MITDLLISVVFLLFLGAGLVNPFIAICGIVWVDVLKPQELSYSFLSGQPLSAVVTALCLASLILNFKKLSKPGAYGTVFFALLLVGWITATTFQASHQEVAWIKYEVAAKTIIIALLLPFVINTRQKFECVLWVLTVTVSLFIFNAGVKTMFGGGGYAFQVITGAENSGVTETSTLAAICVMMQPIYYFLYKYSKFSATSKWARMYLMSMPFIALIAIIGTFARTGLVSLAVLLAFIFFRSKNKSKFMLYIFLGAVLFVPLASEQWFSRMSTITNAGQEDSALGRILVWRWTLDYAAEKPIFGGGFYSYLDNENELSRYSQGTENVFYNNSAKAFHSFFFEVLGEHGYVGLAIYMMMIFTAFAALRKTLMEHKDDEWAMMIAQAMMGAFIAFLVGGLFVGVAFEPWIFYLSFLSVSIRTVLVNEKKIGLE